MRKPRDFDAELKALEDRARELKSRKVQQLGELVIATGADALSAEELAGHVRAERLAAHSLVWRDGMETWQPLASMASELDIGVGAPAMPAGPAALPAADAPLKAPPPVR